MGDHGAVASIEETYTYAGVRAAILADLADRWSSAQRCRLQRVRTRPMGEVEDGSAYWR